MLGLAWGACVFAQLFPLYALDSLRDPPARPSYVTLRISISVHRSYIPSAFFVTVVLNPHHSRRLLLQPRIRKSELIAVFFLRARIIQRALDLASAVATHLTAGGLAAQSVNILLGTGALLFGACPRLRSSGTGTAADGGVSLFGSARLSRLASQRFRHELS